MADKYSGWTEEPAEDEHAGWTEEPAEKVPEMSRLDRVVAAIKSAPGHAVRLADKALDYRTKAILSPIETAKDLTDFSPTGTGGAVVRRQGNVGGVR